MNLKIISSVDEKRELAYYSFRLSSTHDLRDVYWDMKFEIIRGVTYHLPAAVAVYHRRYVKNDYHYQDTYQLGEWDKMLKEDFNDLFYKSLNDKNELLSLLSDSKYNKTILKELFLKRLKYFDEPFEIVQDSSSFEELLNFFKKKEAESNDEL